jgi:hypothetical protein
MHGVLTAGFIAISDGGIMIPTAQYDPGSYIGSDSFVAIVSDCGARADTTSIYITARDCKLRTSTIPVDPVVDINPNPVNNLLHITMAGAKENEIKVINVAGQVVYHNYFYTAVAELNVSALPQGLYFIRINNSAVKKFTKE